LTGTTGYCNISIPEPMLGEDFSVYLSGEPLVKDITYTVKSNGTHYIVCLKYHHSEHTITLKAVETVPEFCSLVFVPLLAVAVVFVICIKKRIQQNKDPLN
ncbi:MAG: hypothetical protein NWF03_02140, partial [Candidatus Bathyarchaeota archaeon]|nr:hypothetical protein [Candidatus Bathyarchaeota archaeon]